MLLSCYLKFKLTFIQLANPFIVNNFPDNCVLLYHSHWYSLTFLSIMRSRWWIWWMGVSHCAMSRYVLHLTSWVEKIRKRKGKELNKLGQSWAKISSNKNCDFVLLHSRLVVSNWLIYLECVNWVDKLFLCHQYMIEIVEILQKS